MLGGAGSHKSGETKEEALKNVKEALALVLEVLKEEAIKMSKKVEEVTIAVN